MTEQEAAMLGIEENTPRLVVLFNGEGGGERFQWGIVGAMPLLTLIGSIVRVQAELAFRAADPCSEPALIIVWREKTKKVDWYVNPSIPVDPLVGMLECVKATLVATHIARSAAAQQIILGPDGRPMRR